MNAKSPIAESLEFHPLTPGRWEDFETLFGKNGACAGCWCMWWRSTAAQFNGGKGAGNRKRMKALIAKGTVPGILAFHQAAPVGWCSIGPREEFPRFDRSRILKPVDDKPVWSIVCFFVKRDVRRNGITGQLIAAALSFAKSKKARIVEAYPVDPAKPGLPDTFVYTGIAETFRKAGFREAARRSATRPIMRFEFA